jgi:ferredoxin-NADP reductase
MERGTLLGRLTWQLGEVVATRPETARTKSITLTVPNWMGHQAGQHVDVRLTAERLDDGEVSPYLTDELRVGDKLELRGPIGGYFVWQAQMGGLLLLVAGDRALCHSWPCCATAPPQGAAWRPACSTRRALSRT